jgi:hypothetical protein
MPPSTMTGMTSTGIACRKACQRSDQLALAAVFMPPRQATKMVAKSSMPPISKPGTMPEMK